MADRTCKKIRKQSQVMYPVPGWGAVLVGLLAMTGGTVYLLARSGTIDLARWGFDEPRWMTASLGFMFLSVGSIFVGWGLRGFGQKRRRRSLQALRTLHPDEPWQADYRWNEAGVTQSSVKEALTLGMFAVFLAVFLMPFNYLAYFREEAPLLVKAVTGFFDVVVLGMAGRSIFLMLRYFKYGEVMLAFRSFPFFLGERLEIEMVSPAVLGGFRKLDLTLRCIEERHETGKEGEAISVCYQVYADTFHAEHGRLLGIGDLSLPVVFDLPNDLPSTQRSARPPVYWEIEVTARKAIVNYRGVFPVPVYAKRRQEVDAS